MTLDKYRPTGHMGKMMKQNHYNKILSAGLTVFHEQGFHASGTQEVVDLAGVSKGSFYNHFKSKDALGLAVLDFYWQNNADTIALLHGPKVPALKRIHRYLAAVGYDENGCLIGNFSIELANSDFFRPRISKLMNTWVEEIAACISDGQDDGTIRKDDSAANLAEFVVVSLEGAIMKAKISRDQGVLKRLRKSVRLFLQNH